jgi:ABC-2 type transport system ATP-binding protein
VGLKEWGKKKVGGFSKGMRQRLGIAQALMNDPQLVVLDEPTDGVDPVGRRDIRNILVKLKGEGRTVFLNSHLLSELEMVCDRVSIMVQGRVASEGTIEELTNDQACFTVRVDPGASSKLGAIAESRPGGAALEHEDALLRVKTQQASEVQPVIDALRAQGIAIHEVRAFRPSLEDLFMAAVTNAETGEVLAPGAASNGAKKGKRKKGAVTPS